jgi:Protein of unknown function (DUF3108)
MRSFAAAMLALFLAWGPSVTTAQQPPTSARPRATVREAAVPFSVGETLTYDVSWSQFVTAGTAVTRVVEKKTSAGSTSYSIVADGRPLPLVARFYPLYYKMESLVDSATLLTESNTLYQEEGAGKRQATTRFDRVNRRAHYELQGDRGGRDDLQIPPNIQDGLTTLYAVRSHRFKAGDRLTVPVVDDGAMYTVQFEVGGPERVRVPFAAADAWSLGVTIVDAQGRSVANNARVWISTDARRLPLKLQADLAVGSFVLALRELRP